MDIQNLGQCTYAGCTRRTNVVTDSCDEFRCPKHRVTCHECGSVVECEAGHKVKDIMRFAGHVTVCDDCYVDMYKG